MATDYYSSGKKGIDGDRKLPFYFNDEHEICLLIVQHCYLFCFCMRDDLTVKSCRIYLMKDMIAIP